MRSNGWAGQVQSRYAVLMDMTAVFQDWDGKTVAPLRQVADGLTPDDYPTLLTACRGTDETAARAASWVVKAGYEAGKDIPYPADLLARDLHWEIALHLLQSIQHVAVDIPPSLITPYLRHDKPMLRAWALDAYVRLGAPDADVALKSAADDPAASVRARARNLTK